MTMELQIANIIWTIFALVIFWAVCRYFVVPTMRDSLRFRLFSIRREMFLFMARGGIDPDGAAYGRLRSLINTSIRYADGLSLGRSVVGVMFSRRLGTEWTRDFDRAIASLPSDARTVMTSYRSRAARAVGIYMLVRSPLGWILAAVAVPLTILVIAFSFIPKKKIVGFVGRRVARRVEQETQVIKCIEEGGAAMAA